MSGSINGYGAPFKACVNEAVKLSRHLMDRVIHRVAVSMPERDAMVLDQQVRKLQTESLQELQKHRLAICDAFPKTLLVEFSRAMSNDSLGSSQKFDTLNLLDESKVMEGVEIARARQASEAGVEGVVGELNALVCSAMGLGSVQESRNPLRPEIYVKALHAVLSAIDVSVEVRSRWMQYFGEAIGGELSKDYAALSKLLIAAGVSKVEFKVLRSPEASEVRAVSKSPVSQHEEPGKGTYIDELAQLQALRSKHKAANSVSAKASGFDREQAFARTSEFPAAPPEISAGLTEAKPGGERANLGASGAAQSSLAKVRQEMEASHHTLELEVVSEMMQRIWDDSRLLPEIREAILRLEPALLRLASADSLFVSNKQHPARKLVQRIVERGMGWRSAEREGFKPFLALIHQAVDTLLETKNFGPEPYSFVLHSMEKIWATQDERIQSKREVDIEQLFVTEQRNGLARAIAISLRKRAKTVEVNSDIVEFLAGPWAQVIAQARVADELGRQDPGGYEDLVTDLLWSAMPAAQTNKARLRKLAPPLLDRLNAGLLTIHYPQPKINAILSFLRDMYVDVLFPKQAVARSTPLSRKEQLEEQLREGDVEALWRVPDERNDSGFMETQPPQITGVALYEHTQPGDIKTLPRASSAGPLPSEDESPAKLLGTDLTIGCWVEFSTHGNWDRWQLTWSKPDRDLYMFTDVEGLNRTLTAKALKEMLDSGQASVLSSTES